MNDNVKAAALGRIAEEAGVTIAQAAAVARLLADGNTVPFIARYRKEVHGNLDEVRILKIQERVAYYGELEERRATILKSIEEQGKLTDELRAKIEKCMVKSALEDLYQPYKPKRRTRAMIARERGLEPLAEIIWTQGAESPDAAAAPFVDAAKEVPDVAAALAGARDICAERLADMAEARGLVRQAFATKAVVKSSVVTPKPTEPTKFEQYYDFEEKISEMPSHRFLAIRRGQTEGVLFMRLVVDAAPLVARLEEIAGVNPRSPLAEELRLAAADAQPEPFFRSPVPSPREFDGVFAGVGPSLLRWRDGVDMLRLSPGLASGAVYKGAEGGATARRPRTSRTAAGAASRRAKRTSICATRRRAKTTRCAASR